MSRVDAGLPPAQLYAFVYPRPRFWGWECGMGKRLLQVSCLLILVCSFLQPSFSQQVAPRPLIVQPIDEARLTTLRGNTHPLAQPQFDIGAAPPNLPLSRMLLVLKRSPEQEFALNKLLDDQQDRASS